MKLSVIVPVYNEEGTVKQLLTKLIGVADVKEVVVINDGSTDNSLKEISKVKSKKIKVFSQKNQGKGGAITTGLKKVTGDYLIIQDADLEYDPDDIPQLLEPIKKGRVEVVYGSRFLGPHSNLLFWHRVGNWLLNMVVNLLYNTTLSDMETCYKVMPTRLVRALKIQAQGFELEPEITCKILQMGIKIFEVPISYVGRDFADGKKITWIDGVKALGVILRLKFSA